MKYLMIPLMICLSSCSLIGPPVERTPRADVLAWEAMPTIAHDNFVGCVAKYAGTHAVPDVSPELIANVAISACQAEFDQYHAIVAQRNETSPRVMGIWSRAATYDQRSDKAALEDARKAALRAVIDARSRESRA